MKVQRSTGKTVRKSEKTVSEKTVKIISLKMQQKYKKNIYVENKYIMRNTNKYIDSWSTIWVNTNSLGTENQSWKILSKIYKNTCDEEKMNM